MFRFVDLFAGIGGFHQAMTALGGECVLASETDPRAAEVYKRNYGIDALRDVRTVGKDDLGEYDVLCAGFPCQPFSKAGERKGFDDETRGTLFFEIRRILRVTKPKCFILENVRNLLSHDGGNTMRVIEDALADEGYAFRIVVLSPHSIGVPQLRERVFILGARRDALDGDLEFEVPKGSAVGDALPEEILEKDADSKYGISDHERDVLNRWDEFKKGIGKRPIGFPIWSEEFTENPIPAGMPKWKENIIRKNRELYSENKEFIDAWLAESGNLSGFTATERKFEWQAGEAIDSVWDGIIQFRPSGIRVKRPNCFPALVAMVQIPIIGKYGRRLTPREAARLQSFPDSFEPDENDARAYRQLGNAVNAECVRILAERLFEKVGVEIRRNASQ